ncbi:flavodoxin [Mucilaginibacter rubeus]|uniref:Flavodoxin n=2 Tax=Sphingobacteriaceae TaxID=84566 RepID=A0AAE6JJC4_9SPHI|nr:flavodoxin [Mucilaginibacter rubeus]QEM19274.1 flavodoxin [Mucilaginibacter gossypii]QEM06685.1 flavodoxin [Mucilaginibacter rubeus]QTE44181.1 flavodoxin [Mucilaginibacter rubeus]QTE50782.1 flavodoxin [Mucilaginibacter rubeus]QTE55863.1 flavodoxin [Mucilaginibacter rubeus]
MKKVIVYCLLICLCTMTSCSKAQTTTAKKILIVYLTRTKNTEAVARMIQKDIGGKLVALELVNPYPADYRAHVAQMVQENQDNFLPPLKTKIDSIGKFDIVFVGFPTWDMKIPPPIKTFLKQYDLSGKTVVPFNTNAGYGVGSGFETVKELCPKSKVLEGYSTKGGIERDGILFVMKDDKERQVNAEVQEWLKKIGLIK